MPFDAPPEQRFQFGVPRQYMVKSCAVSEPEPLPAEPWTSYPLNADSHGIIMPANPWLCAFERAPAKRSMRY